MQIVAGTFAALAAWEAVLHPMAGELREPPRPDVSCDSPDGRVIATRQTEEGTAIAHFSRCGARLTGNAAIAGAPYDVLLGDSFIAARQVDDDETMGAELERIARRSGERLNVRQYGWGGASPAQYIAAAPAVLRKWRPSHVIVLLSGDDFGADTTLGLPPRLLVAADGSWRIDTTGAKQGFLAPAPRVALASLVERRWALLVARAPVLVRRLAALGGEHRAPDAHMDDTPHAEVADAAVRALHETYGGRLLLVYIADVRATDDGAAPAESMMLKACAKHGVRCVSTRPAMLEARRAGVLARGFSTTVIGVGHLNADGHALVAREIWRMTRRTR